MPPKVKVKKEVWPALKEGEVYSLYTTDKAKQFQFGPYVAKFDIPAVFTDVTAIPITLDAINSNEDLELRVEPLEYVLSLQPQASSSSAMRKEGVMYVGDRKIRMIMGRMMKQHEPNYDLTPEEIDIATKDPRIIRILRK